MGTVQNLMLNIITSNIPKRTLYYEVCDRLYSRCLRAVLPIITELINSHHTHTQFTHILGCYYKLGPYVKKVMGCAVMMTNVVVP